ncbi:MAG: 1-deoxy-D-xylulose-5-phosphate reductoisomerase [Planctomycetota bacterium]
MSTRRIIILGSTGSIGTQTIDVIGHLRALRAQGHDAPSFEVVGLAAGRNAPALIEQARALGVRELALACDEADIPTPPDGANLRRGPDAAERLVQEVEADLVLGAMVGSAGLPATLAAIERGIDIALANKETLVAAGEIVVNACARTGSRLLPVDSEHSGLWQCLAPCAQWADPIAARPPIDASPEITRVVLTASGGALRERSLQDVMHATVEDALAHPTWDMGAKVTIDSASLMNKALELIEARWLFGLERARLGVLVHPTSTVHAFVEFADGSVIAQMGAPDMRTPIQYALTHPARFPGRAGTLDLFAQRGLDDLGTGGVMNFIEPDLERFPALGLGWDVIDAGGTSGAIVNAANERAVEAFLDRAIPFGKIPALTRGALDEIGVSPLRDLADVEEADRAARAYVESKLAAANA